MKFINARAGLVLLICLRTLNIWSMPLSPEAWGLEGQQTTLFNGGKYYLVLAQPIGNNTFQAIGIDTEFNETGTYLHGGMWEADNQEHVYIGLPYTNRSAQIQWMTFINDIGGQFSTTGNPVPYGNMLRATGTAPITPNVSYNLTVTDGNAPFASQGSLTFTPAADGTYTIKSASSNTVSSSGTYSYAVTNAVAGCFNITDSINGESTTYFCYYTPTNGFFMLTQPGGGYQVGTFVASSQVLLPAFFNGSTNVTSEVSFLRFTNGTPFGFYDVADFTFPLFYHNDMGFEWFFDANNDAHGAYLYDFSSSTFFYTDPTLFPYLYDFTLNSWLYYCPDTKHAGHYTSNPRWFYQFSNQQFITK